MLESNCSAVVTKIRVAKNGTITFGPLTFNVSDIGSVPEPRLYLRIEQISYADDYEANDLMGRSGQ